METASNDPMKMQSEETITRVPYSAFGKRRNRKFHEESESRWIRLSIKTLPTGH